MYRADIVIESRTSECMLTRHNEEETKSMKSKKDDRSKAKIEHKEDRELTARSDARTSSHHRWLGSQHTANATTIVISIRVTFFLAERIFS